MRLVLHLGAHGTDGGLFANWIARNRSALSEQGIAAPPPRQFLAYLSDALERRKEDDPHVREEALLRSLGANGRRRWMVVSAPGLLGPASGIIAPDGFYQRDVSRRLQGLKALFPRCHLTLLLGLRSASTMVPAILPDGDEAIAQSLPLLGDETLPWSRLVDTIQRQLGHARFVVWQHENVAELWPQILSEMVGPARVLPPDGLLNIATTHLNAEARSRMEHYITGAPPATARNLAQVAAVFARRFGVVSPTDATQNLPAWAQQHLARLDSSYETEWDNIVGRSDVLALQ